MVRSVEESRWKDRAGQWIDDVSIEYDNINAVLERAVGDGDLEIAGTIVGDLNMWWYRTGRHAEGRRWFEVALGHLDALGNESVGRVHVGAGFMAFSDRDVERARHHYGVAIKAADEAGDWRYSQIARCNLSATFIREPDEIERLLVVLTKSPLRPSAGTNVPSWPTR